MFISRVTTVQEIVGEKFFKVGEKSGKLNDI